jgi:hypothetical protein
MQGSKMLLVIIVLVYYSRKLISGFTARWCDRLGGDIQKGGAIAGGRDSPTESASGHDNIHRLPSHFPTHERS